MANNQPIRPLVPTAIRTEFGDVLEDEDFYSHQIGRDLSYVPGYSDLRRARDLALGEYAAGKIKFQDVPTLPVRMQWVRDTKIRTGGPDNTQSLRYGIDGYRSVSKSDIGQPWFTGMPAGAKELADGSIHDSGDCILMVCDQKHAARNAAHQRRATEAMSREAAPSQLMQLGASKPGSDPTFESTPGPSVPVPRSAIKA